MLVPEVTLFVHAIDADAHPTVPPGWRWAVHVGGGRPDDLSRCANAGWAPTERKARLDGEQNAATAVMACRAFGVPAEYRLLALDHDPIPAGADAVRTLR